MSKQIQAPEKEWKHSGLKCYIMKVEYESGSYHRCGYVVIPKNHVCYGLNYNDIPINVHGGLTYGTDNTFGFDTGHWGDIQSDESSEKGHFWTLEEMVKETNKMARQFSKITLLEIIKYKLRYMPKWFTKNIKITIQQEGNA